MGLIAELIFKPELVKHDFRNNDKGGHDDDASQEAGEKEVSSGLTVSAGESHKKAGGHKYGKKEINEMVISMLVDELKLAKNETENHN